MKIGSMLVLREVLVDLFIPFFVQLGELVEQNLKEVFVVVSSLGFREEDIETIITNDEFTEDCALCGGHCDGLVFVRIGVGKVSHNVAP